MTRTFFHVSPLDLEKGSIIRPGNWGRVIDMYPINENGKLETAHLVTVFREHVLETIRKDEFPSKPSRLRSVFVCPTFEAAANFRQRENRPFHLIYEVRPISEPASIHHGDYNAVQLPNGQKLHAGMMDQARRYWRGESICQPEVLFPVGIEIIGRVDLNE